MALERSVGAVCEELLAGTGRICQPPPGDQDERPENILEGDRGLGVQRASFMSSKPAVSEKPGFFPCSRKRHLQGVNP